MVLDTRRLWSSTVSLLQLHAFFRVLIGMKSVRCTLQISFAKFTFPSTFDSHDRLIFVRWIGTCLRKQTEWYVRVLETRRLWSSTIFRGLVGMKSVRWVIFNEKKNSGTKPRYVEEAYCKRKCLVVISIFYLIDMIPS
jgi:hypothetical protein